MVAIEKGFFKDQGIDVKFQPILTSADRMRGITSGDVQFTNLGRTAVLSAMARGDNSFYILANVDDSPGKEGCWAVEKYKTAASLKGKKVAANGSAEITLNGILMRSSVAPAEVNIINLSPTEMAGALAKGDIDAACVWEPLFAGLKTAVPNGNLIGTDKDTDFYKKYGTMPAGDIVIISKKYADANPLQASKLTAAMFQGSDFTIANPKEAAKLVAPYFKKKAEELEPGIADFAYFGTENWKKHLSLHVESMQELANVLFSTGKIPAKPTVANWVNAALVPAPLPKK
jgi:NitT/TauT family transport system substrate-binding protein